MKQIKCLVFLIVAFALLISCQSKVDRLIGDIKNNSTEQKENASKRLAKIATKQVVDKLIAIITTHNPSEITNAENVQARKYAAITLGRIGDQKLIGRLLEVLRDRSCINSGLSQDFFNTCRPDIMDALEQIDSNWRKSDIAKHEIQYFINSLKNPSCRPQDLSSTLIEFVDSQALNPLIEILKDKALTQLWRNNSKPSVRIYAAELLGKIGDSRATDLLIRILRDKTEDIRREAADALGNIGDSSAVNTLIETLRSESEDKYLKRVSVIALGKLGNPKVADIIITYCKSGDFQEAAIEALDIETMLPYIKNNDKSAKLFAATLSDDKIGLDTKKRILNILSKIKDSNSMTILVEALKNWDINSQVAETLDNVGWFPKTDMEKIHFFAAKKNGKPLKEIWQTTKQVLLEDVKSDESEIIKNAVFTFIGIGNNDIMPDLIKTLNNYGTKVMAEAFLNSGNDELNKAARTWASYHGYFIERRNGENPVNWGSW